MNIAICEHGGEILFLHRLVPGPSDRSYGVEVAKLAGVPMPVVQRARQILESLENKEQKSSCSAPIASKSTLPGLDLPPKESFDPPPPLPFMGNQGETPPVHPLIQILQDCNPELLSPMDALQKITEWKILWGKPE